MIDYRAQGLLPEKPHTVHRDAAGALLYEECFTREGFDGPFSILYHRHPPQLHGGARRVEALFPGREEATDDGQPVRRRHVDAAAVAPGGTATSGRVPLLYNGDLTIGALRPTSDDDFLFANGDGDDLFYIQEGGGVLLSPYGELRFGAQDYVLVPRAVPHRFVLDAAPQHWLWMELRSGLRTPAQYRNPVGQLRMDAPYTHRDFRSPVLSGPVCDDTRVISKRQDRFTEHRYPHPVCDLVGWDGTVYPFVFPILRFSPKIGQVHLPPTVHGTFATRGSLICSFVPRNVDFHPKAIPCPYPHSNVDVDEVLFYCDGDFTSRRGVHAGSVSLHPAACPHGPHPGAYERSIGTRETRELAVMVDTFEPLKVTPQATRLEVAGYDESWQD